MFLREESRNKINTIKCTLDQLSKRDGTVCSDTERPIYRKSANYSIMLTNEKPIVIVKKLILTKKIFWTITTHCKKKVGSLHLQEKLNQSQNQVQSTLNQWKGRNKIQNLKRIILVDSSLKFRSFTEVTI